MEGRKIRTTLALFAGGISLVIIALSLSALVENPTTRTFLLGSGIIILSLSLILLQLGFYREGDARKATKSSDLTPPHQKPVPRQLKNPRLAAIWRNMEETRRLMKLKEKSANENQMRKEKILLGLSDEEEILFMTDRSSLYFWPLSLLSLILVTASTVVSGVPSFLFLLFGLLGLLSPLTANRMTRYYITNFRLLVRRKPFMGNRTRWSTMNYTEIHRCTAKKAFALGNLRLEGKKGAMDIRGIGAEQFEAVSGILREKLPEGACHFSAEGGPE